MSFFVFVFFCLFLSLSFFVFLFLSSSLSRLHWGCEVETSPVVPFSLFPLLWPELCPPCGSRWRVAVFHHFSVKCSSSSVSPAFLFPLNVCRYWFLCIRPLADVRIGSLISSPGPCLFFSLVFFLVIFWRATFLKRRVEALAYLAFEPAARNRRTAYLAPRSCAAGCLGPPRQ